MYTQTNLQMLTNNDQMQGPYVDLYGKLDASTHRSMSEQFLIGCVSKCQELHWSSRKRVSNKYCGLLTTRPNFCRNVSEMSPVVNVGNLVAIICRGQCWNVLQLNEEKVTHHIM